MKIPLGKVFQIVQLVYTLFVKGRRVKLPGGGEFTFPSQKHTLPKPVGLLGAYSGPEHFYGPERRDDPEGDVPFPMQTLGVILFVIFGLPIAAVALLAGWEYRTLVDDIPGNHITACLRAAFRKQPGAVTLALVVWVAFLVAIFVGLGAHAWWQ